LLLLLLLQYLLFATSVLLHLYSSFVLRKDELESFLDMELVLSLDWKWEGIGIGIGSTSRVSTEISPAYPCICSAGKRAL
jgi:hypothetical protein